MPVVLSEQTAKHRHLLSGTALRTSRSALGLLAAITLSGCVFVPRTTSSYNEECQIVEKQMKLTVALLMDQPPNCSKAEDCAVFLALLGGVAAGSAVVSGSVVLVGNTLYWLEEQGKCDWPVAEKLKKLPESLRASFPSFTPTEPPSATPVSAEFAD